MPRLSGEESSERPAARKGASWLELPGLIVAGLVVAGAAMAAVSARDTNAPMASAYLLSPSQIFIFFFVMLGPLKLLTPFVRVTEEADERLRRGLAVRATLVATASLAVAATFGAKVLDAWEVSTSAMLIAAGVLLSWVAFRMVTAVYAPPETTGETAGKTAAPPSPRLAVVPLAFPGVVTPYGLAVLILLVANAGSTTRLIEIIAALALVLVLDLLAMLFARPLLRWLGPALPIVGAALGVLQVALGVELVLLGVETFTSSPR